MGTLSYATTFVSGGTLTAAQLEEMKTEIAAVINQNIDAANIKDATVTNAKLVSGNADFSILVKPVNSPDALTAVTTTPIVTSEFANAVPGVDRNQTGLATHFQIPVNCTAIGISVFARTSAQGAPTTRNNSAQLFVAGTAIDSPVTFATGDAVNSGSFSQAMLTTGALEIRVATDSGAAHGVTDPHVWIHCIAAHTA